MEDLDLLVFVFIPHVECCLLIVSRERWRVCLLNSQLPEFLGDRRCEEGSLAPAEIPRGRHTLARGQESRRGVSVHVQDPSLEMRWETGSPLPPLQSSRALSGCSFCKVLCQGRQWYCFLPIFRCHLIRIDPVLPRGPGLFTVLIHKAICTYTSSPVRNS